MNDPYSTYCTKHMSGFDAWNPVLINARLPPILQSFSSLYPPPQHSVASASVWTLDMLFSLPRERVKYYHRLYGKLLRNAVPGGCTDKLLSKAVEKLEELDNNLECKLASGFSSVSKYPGNIVSAKMDETVVIDSRGACGSANGSSCEDSYQSRLVTPIFILYLLSEAKGSKFLKMSVRLRLQEARICP